MAHINLLPWREELRQEKKKEFLTQLGGVCIVAVLVAFVWVRSVDSSIQSQSGRNNLLKSEIKMLEKQVAEIQTLKNDRKRLSDLMQVIQNLEGKRAIIVRYFDEIAKAIPNGVYLIELERKGNGFVVQGISESNNRISDFMRGLEDSDWFTGTRIISITAKPELGPQVQEFALSLTATEGENAGEEK